MTIDNLLNEMSSKDIENIDLKKSNVEIAKQYLKNYEERTGKPLVSIISIKKTFASVVGDDLADDIVDEIRKLIQPKTVPSAQARTSSGLGFENTLEEVTNAVKDSSSVGELYINGQTLNFIINNNSDFSGVLNGEKTELKTNLNIKRDMRVDEKKWLWKTSGLAVKDGYSNIASSSKSPLYLELKSSKSKSPSVSGTMLFEWGKVSSFAAAYKILTSLKVIPFKEEEYKLLNLKRTEENTVAKSALQNKVSNNVNQIKKEQKNVNEFMSNIIKIDALRKVVEDQLRSYDNYFIVVGNSTDALNNKIGVIDKVSDYGIQFKVSTWKGFGRIVGSFREINESEESDNFGFEIKFNIEFDYVKKNAKENAKNIAASVMTDSYEELFSGFLKEMTTSGDAQPILTRLGSEPPINKLFGNSKKKKKKRGSKCSK